MNNLTPEEKATLRVLVQKQIESIQTEPVSIEVIDNVLYYVKILDKLYQADNTKRATPIENCTTARTISAEELGKMLAPLKHAQTKQSKATKADTEALDNIYCATPVDAQQSSEVQLRREKNALVVRIAEINSVIYNTGAKTLQEFQELKAEKDYLDALLFGIQAQLKKMDES